MSTQIKAPQIATDAVIAAKVKDGELTVAKMATAAIALAADVEAGTSATKFITPSALNGASVRIMKANNDDGQREEKKITRVTPVTTAQVYLRITMNGASAYGVAYVDVVAIGIGNGVASAGAHARYFVRLDNTTVVIEQIGSTEATSVATATPVLSSAVSGYEARFSIAKNAGSTGFDGEIITTVNCGEGSNLVFTIAYA